MQKVIYIWHDGEKTCSEEHEIEKIPHIGATVKTRDGDKVVRSQFTCHDGAIAMIVK